MNVLVACEFSGIVRDQFTALGHSAMSCDFLDSERPGWHHRGDVRDAIEGAEWDLMIAFPPCTYLCSSGLHWNKRRPERAALTHDAMLFVFTLIDADIPRIALENPKGCISTNYRKPDQVIQPHQFGHDASKTTHLWLKNLPLLRPTKLVDPRIVDGKKRWSNQTDSGQNRLAPSAHRWKDRSRTYEGIGAAMASQWSST